MRKLLLAVWLITTIPVFSQQKLTPLPGPLFSKMIVRDITYAITGEATPASGIKVDLSKPEGTITGTFPTPRHKYLDLFGFEFKGGVTDKNFSLLKGFKTFNTAGELKLLFHYIPYSNSAFYLPGQVPILVSKLKLLEDKQTAVKDSFYAIATIFNRYISTNFADAKEKDESLPEPERLNPYVLMYFLSRHVYGATMSDAQNATQWLTCVQTALPANDGSISNYLPLLFADYEKYKKLAQTIGEEVDKAAISNAAPVYTSKHYRWWTLAPLVRGEKTNEFRKKFENRDSLYFAPNSYLSYGLTLYYNRYWLGRNYAHYLRPGISLRHTNNLAALSLANFETRSPLMTNGSQVTQKVKTGGYYNYDDINSGSAIDVTMDYYFLPLQTFYPGFYLSMNAQSSTLYRLQNVAGRQTDNFRLSLETGLVFNITSREKDKERNLLSILTYFRHEDLTDKLRTDIPTGITETKQAFLDRNISFGFRVGIPINLPQRSQ